MNELKTLHEAMTATLKAGLPEVVTVEAYPEIDNEFGLPAVFFGLSGFHPGTDTGTGKTALNGTFQAIILVDPVKPHASLQASWLAAKLSMLLHAQYWDLDFVEGAEGIEAKPDDSSPELASFLVWVVQWTQVLHVGLEQWPWPDEPPGTLVFDFGPGVGEVRPEDLE